MLPVLPPYPCRRGCDGDACISLVLSVLLQGISTRGGKGMSKPGIIQEEPDGVCELCGKVAETRPYGPKREEICFACGTKDTVGPEPNGEA